VVDVLYRDWLYPNPGPGDDPAASVAVDFDHEPDDEGQWAYVSLSITDDANRVVISGGFDSGGPQIQPAIDALLRIRDGVDVALRQLRVMDSDQAALAAEEG